MTGGGRPPPPRDPSRLTRRVSRDEHRRLLDEALGIPPADAPTVKMESIPIHEVPETIPPPMGPPPPAYQPPPPPTRPDPIERAAALIAWTMVGCTLLLALAALAAVWTR